MHSRKSLPFSGENFPFLYCSDGCSESWPTGENARSRAPVNDLWCGVCWAGQTRRAFENRHAVRNGKPRLDPLQSVQPQTQLEAQWRRMWRSHFEGNCSLSGCRRRLHSWMYYSRNWAQSTVPASSKPKDRSSHCSRNWLLHSRFSWRQLISRTNRKTNGNNAIGNDNWMQRSPWRPVRIYWRNRLLLATAQYTHFLKQLTVFMSLITWFFRFWKESAAGSSSGSGRSQVSGLHPPRTQPTIAFRSVARFPGSGWRCQQSGSLPPGQ